MRPVKDPTSTQMEHAIVEITAREPAPTSGEDTASALPRYLNPGFPLETRITDFISCLNIDEKIACLGTDPSVPRLGIRGSGHVEGLHGLALGGPGEWCGIGKEPITTTTFPQAIGMAQTWNPKLVKRAGRIEGVESRYVYHKLEKGGLVVRAPNADLGRDPRWGRTEECYGEDAYVNGVLATAFVKGLQGDDPYYWQTATIMKHFLANSHEDERGWTSSDFDVRLWREYYAMPFWMAVRDGGARGFMAAYNAYNGIPCAVHPMLKRIGQDEWKVDGIICTDGGAMTQLQTLHKRYKTLAEAAAECVKAGIGQFLDEHVEPVRQALAKGLLTEEEVDEAIRGPVRVMFRLGLFDPACLVPFTKIADGPPPWENDDHKEVALRVTEESIVLLKNDGLLPIDKTSVGKVAVIGRWADQVLLDWYSGTPSYAISPFQGVANSLGYKAKVTFNDGQDLKAAAKLAAGVDLVVLCVGNHPTGNGPWEQVEKESDGKEAVDRKSIDLDEEELVKVVLAANPRTIVVLITSFCYAINWTKEHAPAILQMAHNSQETGTALAKAIFGEINPGGKLVQTWPKSLEGIPPIRDYDIRKGRTYMYSTQEPLFPFGFGLSYTTFEYREVRTTAETLAPGEEIKVTVSVANSGERDGDEVVQLYARFLDSRVDRPRKKLVGFSRLRMRPGKMKVARFPLTTEVLAYWDHKKHAFVAESGRVELLVGSSSEDIRLTKTISVKTHG